MKDLDEAKRIKSCEVADLASEGVQRALAARKAALELTPAQTEEVSGGIGFVNPIIYGGPFFTSAVNPASMPGLGAGKTVGF